MRVAFEQEMKARGIAVGLRTADGYEDRIVQFFWEIWKAAAGERVDAPDHTEDMMRMVRRWSEGLESDNSLRAYFKLFNQE